MEAFAAPADIDAGRNDHARTLGTADVVLQLGRGYCSVFIGSKISHRGHHDPVLEGNSILEAVGLQQRTIISLRHLCFPSMI
ncbi:hypothetical protein D3C75_1167210 [compost metagenome]